MGPSARTTLAVTFAVCGGVGVASCLVDIPDVVDGSVVDAGSDAMSSADGGTLADVVVPVCDGACGAPAGFAPVLFASNQQTACPTGDTTLNGSADPSLGSACACDCTVSTPPSCVPQQVVHYNDDIEAGVCNNEGPTYTLDGGCNQVTPFMLAPHWSIPSLSPVAAGACTSKPANDPSAASVTPARLCVDSTCKTSCSAPTGFETCFFASGGGVPAEHDDPSRRERQRVMRIVQWMRGHAARRWVRRDGDDLQRPPVRVAERDGGRRRCVHRDGRGDVRGRSRPKVHACRGRRGLHARRRIGIGLADPGADGLLPMRLTQFAVRDST